MKQNSTLSVTGAARARVALIAVGGISVLLFGALAASANERSRPPISPVPRSVLLDPNNQPDIYAELPPDKQRAIDSENALRAQSADHPYSGRPTGGPSAAEGLTVTPPYLALPHNAAGNGTIVQYGCGQELKGYDFDGWNEWFGPVRDGGLIVCAGQQRADPSKGVVMVQKTNADRTLRFGRAVAYASDGEHGRLLVTGATGDVLTLQAKDGTSFYFDVSALKYVDGLSLPATATPGAEATANTKAGPKAP